MDARQTSSASPAHPASARRMVGKWALWFGILAAPLAWSAQELLSYGVASRECGMKSARTAAALSTATSPWLMAILTATFLVALAGLLVATRNWHRTRRGSGHHLPHPAEGRARFMAMWGLLTSIGFVIAFFFTAAYMLAAPVCGK